VSPKAVTCGEGGCAERLDVSIPKIPEPALVVVSVLTPTEDLLPVVLSLLTDELGKLGEQIGPLAFSFTKYYDREMGSGIRRWLWWFVELRDRSELITIKLLTNRIEQAYANEGRRKVNLDPGMLTLGSLVLATGKESSHRIYLGEGIFADLTLVYRSGSYRPLEWTYPDYADSELIGILNGLREMYKWKLKHLAARTAL